MAKRKTSKKVKKTAKKTSPKKKPPRKSRSWVLPLGLPIIAVLIIFLIPFPWSFHHEIDSSLDPSRLWGELATGFADSSSSQIWPTSIEEASANDLGVGDVVTATYKVGRGTNIQLYTITQADDFVLAYQSVDSHPLRGGGEVRVIETASGSKLVWDIQYKARLSQPSLWYLFYFNQRFFGELEDNIRAIE